MSPAPGRGVVDDGANKDGGGVGAWGDDGFTFSMETV